LNLQPTALEDEPVTATTHPAPASADLHPLLADRRSPRAFDATATLGADQLDLLLDAARWAPSAANTQPWRFVAGRRGDRAFNALLAALNPANQEWARDAAALVLVAAETADAEGAPRPWAVYDAGQAAAHLTAQASALGLSVRQMGGFRAAELPALPERVTPLVVVAVGVALSADRIPEGHPATRLPARDRRPLRELLVDVA
jgi:nitroreductase